MIKLFRNIKNRLKQKSFLKKQMRKVHLKGSLLNAFYSKKIIFVHIPKTAGISVAKAIFGDVSLEGHRSIMFYKNLFNEDFSEYFTFSVVRNPWDRLYSAFKFLEKGGINIHDRNAYEQYLEEYKDFEDFVTNGLNKKMIYEIMHFIPQSEFICSKDGKIDVNYIARFENLKDDISKLSEKINNPIELDHHNSNKKVSYKEIYTSDMIKKVEEIYKMDIINFNYKF
ncbi:MAG: sulfotransferase family 2 domain-containing protein [Flavobacteriales bacterium]|nr:sulfotransferase family 2 domain-containing protein [Flavobacteriales bacterium]